MASLRVYYGGTFDPVHAGHLAMARAAAVALGVPVRLMPAADPPHRALPGADARHRAAMLDLAVEGQPMLRVDRRELHREGRSYTIHTLHQLRAEYGADAPLAFVIGADSLRALHTWKDWRALLDGAHLVVAERPGNPLDDLIEADLVAPDLAGATPSEAASNEAALLPLTPGVEALGVAAAAQPDAALRQALFGRWAVSADALRQRPGGRVLRLRQPLHPASATEIRRRIAAGDAEWPLWLAPTVADYIRRYRLYGFHGDIAARDGVAPADPAAPAAPKTGSGPS